MFAAKESIVNSYIQEFTTSAAIVNRTMSNAFYGYPEGYLEQYPKKIQAVTRADVQHLAQKLLDPAHATMFLVGDPSLYEKPLAVLGKPQEVKLVDYFGNSTPQ